jgi:hypothetical protein
MAGYVEAGSHTPDNLIAGTDLSFMTKGVTIEKGQRTVKRGTLLGKITLGAVSAAAAGAGAEGANTGDGTLTPDTTAPLLANAQLGTYLVKITKAAAAPALATARVTDPKGNVIGDIQVAGGSGSTFTTQIKFVIKEGDTPFVAGDAFAVTVAAGSGKYKVANKAAVDGSQIAECVLSHDVTVADDADGGGVAYKTGVFNRNALIVADGDTVTAHEDELRKVGIQLKDEFSISEAEATE